METERCPNLKKSHCQPGHWCENCPFFKAKEDGCEGCGVNLENGDSWKIEIGVNRPYNPNIENPKTMGINLEKSKQYYLMYQLYQELKERRKVLENDKSKHSEHKIAELQLIIIRVQQILLDNM
jgi:hypothetical protein